MRTASPLLLAGLLAACSGGDAPEPNPLIVVGRQIAGATGLAGDNAGRLTVDPARDFTQAQIADWGPTFAAHIVEPGLWSSATLLARGVGAETYVTPDDVALYLNAHLVRGTRGLGADLLAADPEPTIAALTQGAPFGPYQRRYAFLDEWVSQVTLTATCSLSLAGEETVVLAQRAIATQRSDETCRIGEETFTNIYWQDLSTGVIVRSRQWISPTVGEIELYALKD